MRKFLLWQLALLLVGFALAPAAVAGDFGEDLPRVIRLSPDIQTDNANRFSRYRLNGMVDAFESIKRTKMPRRFLFNSNLTLMADYPS